MNHNSCCKGKASEYNIRVGRAREVTGPYLDKHGRTMAEGGGSMFLAAHDHRIGPGHFGRVVDYDEGDSKNASDANDVEAGSEAAGAERFSVHYEADMTRGGRSVLDIRPLLWSLDGWPVAGDNIAEGTYQLVSRMSENTLEETVSAANGPSAAANTNPTSVPDVGHPGGAQPGKARLNRYLTLDNQKWTIAPVEGGFYKIVNAGTGDALGVSELAPSLGGTVQRLLALTPYTGTDAQLWHLDQFPDGGWRIRNKADGLSMQTEDLRVEGSGVALGLLMVGVFTRDDGNLWEITTP